MANVAGPGRQYREQDVVKIARSDGRVHDAKIIGIYEDRKMFSVQWYEDGESKGKEIDFDVIFELNRPNTESAGASAATNTRARKDQRRTKLIGNHQRRQFDVRTEVVDLDIPLDDGYENATAGATGGVSSRTTKRILRSAAGPSSLDESRRLTMFDVQQNPRRRGARILSTHEEEVRQPPPVFKVEKGNPNYEFQKMILDYMKAVPYRPISKADAVLARRICVAIRKRPLNRKEIHQKEIDVVSIPTKDKVLLHEPKIKVDLMKYLDTQEFRFDYAFDEAADNELVYHFTARPLVHSIFQGGMASCFAYGQTGSGKTHTMGGDFKDRKQVCETGIYSLATRDIFELLKSKKYASENLKVTASFFEIYSGRVVDLMTKTQLRVLEDGKQQVQVVGLQDVDVQSVEHVLKMIQTGSAARSSGVTAVNQNSSRSHAIFQINLKKRSTGALHGKLYIIDLAGNERGADTMSANKQTRQEGAEINKSLLALKECIRALSFKSVHLPFRASTLTKVLRDSFVGDNSRTCMIATVSPGMSSGEHTLNTLRYANRVKELEVNENEPENVKGAAAGQTNGHHDVPEHHESFEDDEEEIEISAKLNSFHEILTEVSEKQDDIVQYHQQFMDLQSNWTDVLLSTLDEAITSGYEDMHGYIQKLRIILQENLEATQIFLDKTDSLSDCLRKEEECYKGLEKTTK